MIQFRLKGCKKCGGDLTLDQGDWICLQCGTYYYVHLYRDTGPGLQHSPVKKPAAGKAEVGSPMLLGPQHAMITLALASVFLPSGAVNK